MTVIETMNSDLFSKVRDNIEDAILVAWDECHKIYMAMDETEAEWFRQSYPVIVEDGPVTMLIALAKWWEASCGLRFIRAVSSNPADPNAVYETMIDQGADWDDEDEDEDEED